jgi:hypothetical protein
MFDRGLATGRPPEANRNPQPRSTGRRNLASIRPYLPSGSTGTPQEANRNGDQRKEEGHEPLRTPPLAPIGGAADGYLATGSNVVVPDVPDELTRTRAKGGRV